MMTEDWLRQKINEIGEKHQRAYLEETAPLRKALVDIISCKLPMMFLPLDVDVDLKP